MDGQRDETPPPDQIGGGVRDKRYISLAKLFGSVSVVFVWVELVWQVFHFWPSTMSFASNVPIRNCTNTFCLLIL